MNGKEIFILNVLFSFQLLMEGPPGKRPRTIGKRMRCEVCKEVVRGENNLKGYSLFLITYEKQT